jgi:hypothetical protein
VTQAQLDETHPETPAAKAKANAAEIAQELDRRPWMAIVLAAIFPGLGHLYLGRRHRALLFAVVVLCAAALGVALHGNLWTPIPGRPLTWLATFGSMGMGLPYFILLFAMSYAGDITAPGFEYGTAFLLGAGLMNLLLVLDTWDIATGRKE